VTRDETIRTEEVRDCLLCAVPGTLLYGGLTDRLFGTPGQWGFLQCTRCGLAWLNPRPIVADVGRMYQTYYTHAQSRRNDNANFLALIRRRAKGGLYAVVSGCNELASSWIWRQLGRPLSWVPLLRERALMGMMCLKAADRGKILDLGCGDGLFLALMRDAGWEVNGVEPDPEAAKVAQQKLGSSVMLDLEQAAFPDGSFDAVTLSHVIEHVHDPVALLAECRRVLKPGGNIVIVTPNINSLGHHKFGSSWRGLEPPRHLNIFSRDTLRLCCDRAGLCVRSVRTSARSSARVWQESKAIGSRKQSARSGLHWWPELCGTLFNLYEDFLCRVSPETGEEIVVVAGNWCQTCSSGQRF
jgi:2-polyprenyl-3-methyl-5-hydroxy-6-metoxy-1,4-benzoquinol methylase